MALVSTEVCRIRRSGGQQVPAGAGLGLSGVGQVHVHPAREEVLGVPGRLAVAEEDEIEHAYDGIPTL
jgi:hypothetical protein